MSTKKKKTKEEMLNYICQTDKKLNDDEELINQIEYGLYAIMADANMLMRMLDKLRENAK